MEGTAACKRRCASANIALHDTGSPRTPQNHARPRLPRPAAVARPLRGRLRRSPAVVDAFGLPPLWERDEGFGTLLLLILEQQVSLASARAAFDRVAARLGGPPTPAGLLALDDDALRADGFSRQKTRYAPRAGRLAVRATLDLAAVRTLDDDGVRAALTALPGIGPWTADVYLVMALRPARRLPGRRPRAAGRGPGAPGLACAALGRRARRPRRAVAAAPAVAARVLWLHYLGTRGRL